MLTHLLILFLSGAYAIIGPKIPSYDHPDQICVIKYAYKSNPDEITGVCSGALVKPDSLLTAGHCLSDKDYKSVPVEVLCPSGETSKVIRQLRNPDYIDVSKAPDSSRSQDLGLYFLETKINTAPIKVVKNESTLKKILQTTRVCGLFGYGGRHPESPNAFELQGGLVDPSSVEFKEGVLWIDSFRNFLGSMILPGDSGGSFACKNKNNQWVHLGQNSAMSYNYESLITPAYLATKFIDLKNIKAASLFQKTESLKRKLKLKIKNLMALSKELQEKGTNSLERIDLLSSKIRLYSRVNLKASNLHALEKSLEKTRKGLDALYRKQFKTGQKYFVNKFAHVLKTKSSLLLKNGSTEVDDYDRERLDQFSTLNVGDNPSNQFSIESIEDGKAFGALKVQGTTQHYGCVAMILCRKKIVTDVVIDLKDLRL